MDPCTEYHQTILLEILRIIREINVACYYSVPLGTPLIIYSFISNFQIYSCRIIALEMREHSTYHGSKCL